MMSEDGADGASPAGRPVSGPAKAGCERSGEAAEEEHRAQGDRPQFVALHEDERHGELVPDSTSNPAWRVSGLLMS